VVVKAPDRQGQKGLTLVEDPAHLPGAVGTARSVARNGVALVEELVDGPEVTVVGFSISGVFTALAVTDRITAEPPAFGVALAHVFESPHAQVAAVVAAGAARALGIEDGPSYTQLRVGPDGPQVIEVAARLGGGHDAELVLAATGVDLNGLAIAAALDQPVGAPQPRHRAGGAVTRFLIAPPGALDRVEVPEGLAGVEAVRIYRERGYVFAPLRRGADRAGAILVLGEDREQAVARAEAAAQRIRFVTADAGALLQAN
jgi:biotin carboxylase